MHDKCEIYHQTFAYQLTKFTVDNILKVTHLISRQLFLKERTIRLEFRKITAVMLIACKGQGHNYNVCRSSVWLQSYNKNIYKITKTFAYSEQ